MPNDLDLLQGSWSVTAMEADGQKMPAEMLAGGRVLVQGDRFTSTGMGVVYEGRLELDESREPRQFDMKFDAGPEKGNTNLGIYELDGDIWTICLATRGSVRPSVFASTPGGGCAVETLVRGVAPAAAKSKPRASSAKKAAPAAHNGPAAPAASSGRAAPSGRATEFDGEWSLVSAIMNGKAMEPSVVQWVKRVTEGKQTTVLAGPQTMLKVEFAFDASPSPKTIDYLNLAGANKGKTQYGIYEFDGDALKFCVAAPGAQRPAQFQSEPGDGRTLTIWKKP
jgi:uncharacterized protein (TIGR03067 family)